MSATTENVTAALRSYHAIIEEWTAHRTDVEIQLFGTVPNEVYHAHVRREAIAQKPELWAKYLEVATELDVLKSELEVRMVEAHEWMRQLREAAERT